MNNDTRKMETFYSTARSNTAITPRNNISEETEIVYFPLEGRIEEMHINRGVLQTDKNKELEQRLNEK
jgi:hypothetical protein